MKYYAVTNDPAELMHFGVKGMKWGVIRTPAQLGHFKAKTPKRSRSAAYKKAQNKISKLMKKNIVKSGIKAVEAQWKEYQSPEARRARERQKAQKNFEKHLQLARQGRLKYKGISDAEVEKITDRLALERSARSLSGAEKPSFRRRLGAAISEGIIAGVGRGVGDIVQEKVGRGSKLKTDRMRMEQANRINSKADRERRKRDSEQDVERRRRDLKQDKERRRQELLDARSNARLAAQNDVDKEYFKTAYENGERAFRITNRRRARYIADTKNRREYDDEVNERIKNRRKTFDTNYYAQTGKNAANYTAPNSGALPGSGYSSATNPYSNPYVAPFDYDIKPYAKPRRKRRGRR